MLSRFFYVIIEGLGATTTRESSGGRGKRKELRGKRRGATKTNAFVAVSAFFNTDFS